MNTNAFIEMLAARILEHFTEADWKRVELVLDASHLITGHSRLMRSLHFGDKDYELHVFDALRNLGAEDSTHLTNIKNYLNEKYPLATRNISAASGIAGEVEITVSPKALSIPKKPQERDLIAVLMPSSSDFDLTFQAISSAAQANAFRCEQVNELWDEGVTIQEVFDLIYHSHLVIADFSTRDPNVFYGVGIAHLLGRTVIPISQSKDDLPCDLRRLRFSKYAPNDDGFARLSADLTKKLAKHKPE